MICGYHQNLSSAIVTIGDNEMRMQSNNSLTVGIYGNIVSRYDKTMTKPSDNLPLGEI